MEKYKLTRRSFLAGTAATIATGCTTMRKGKAPGKISTKSPNEVVNFAGIGCGGKGASDIQGCLDAGVNLIALCDADLKQGKPQLERHPEVPHYQDFRKMLDEHKEIDAVNVSIPDHMHAMVAVHAMKMGKHVYVQKPLAHNIFEAREMRRIAKEMKVATQMGNQGHCGDGVRQVCELIWAGAIGDVKEVYTWTNRPIWPQAIPDPLPKEPVPDTLNWDIWLGGAPFRDYNHGYCPFNWRGWWDFGCGALGDMACHIMDPANWSLNLGVPTSVEVVMQEGCNVQTGPDKSILKYSFPARSSAWYTDTKGKRTDVKKDFPACTLYWYDGREGNNPIPRPKDLPGPDVLELGSEKGQCGTLFIGSKGYLTCGTYGQNPRLLPEGNFTNLQKPAEVIPRIEKGDDGSQLDFIKACKGDGYVSCSNFEYAAPFTEIILLGNLALRSGSSIQWDIQNMKVTNNEAANQYVKQAYRKGWSL